jgi:hypothetical protein
MISPIDLIVLVVFALLQAGDGWTTYQALKKAGNIEANRIVARIMSLIGVIPALVVLKGGIVVFIGAAFWFAPSVYLTVGILAINVFYAIVVWKNYQLT